MSLLHRPHYEIGYTEEEDKEGLKKLLWSQFMCKCGLCSIKTGKNFMERLPVFILDEIAQEERMRFDVRLAYTCKRNADKLALTSKNPHRVGLGVKIRLINNKKRFKLIRGLVMRGVSRFSVSNEFVYFDTDDLKPMSFHIKEGY